MQSQCPHCNSAFEISSEAINAAEGIVRCGQCMQLFDAHEYCIEENTSDSVNSSCEHLSENGQPATATEQAVPSAGNEFQQPSETKTSVDNNTNGAEFSTTTNFTDNASLIQETNASNAKHPEQAPDSVQALLNMDLQQTSTETAEAQAFEPKTSVAETEKYFVPEVEMNSLLPTDSHATERSAEHDEKLIDYQQQITRPPGGNVDAATAREVSLFDDTPSAQNSEDIAYDENTANETPLFDPAADAPEILPPLLGEKKRSSTGNRSAATALFGSICFTLTLLLILQWALGMSDSKNWHASTKTLSDTACQIFYCARASTGSGFQSRDKVIQSHPNKANALILKASLVNTARRAQPFPNLALEFSNLEDQTFARRVFRPEEYLNPALIEQNAGSIPANTPVKIVLELVDPGPDAVNYSLRYFLPKDQTAG